MNQLYIAAIHDLVKKTYTFDSLIQYSTTILKPHPPVYYFVYLCRLYSQRQKAQTVQQQQQLNKVINAYEDSFADIMHELKSIVWDDHLVNAITKCVTLNSNLFRNHQRQLQELCITKYSNLFAVLQFAKQNNVANLISNTIEQLVDAFYVMVSQLDTSKDQQVLHSHWQETLLTEEFRSILQLNSKAKHSLVFSLINITEFEITSFKETLTRILNLLSAQLSYIKEDIVLDVQIEKILKMVKDILLMNDGRVELNKLLIEKRITLTPEIYDELIHFIREKALGILLNLVQSSFAENLIQNSFSDVLLKFTDRPCCEGFEEILGDLIVNMQRANFLTTRLEISLQMRIITTIENEFPKFMKNMHNYTKTERLQIQVTKRQPKSKDIQLGFSTNDQLDKQKVRKLRNSFRVQFLTLANICVNNLTNGHSLEVTKKLYQMLFMICSFPHDHLLLYSGPDVIQALLHLSKVILYHYNELEICFLQPIKYFVEYLINSETFLLDLKLQEQCNGFIDLIDFIYTKKKTLIVDNYVSIQKSLNDQFQKMQQLYQSTNSEEQYYSCKMDQSENQQAQIRRTKSLVGEEESNSKPKEYEDSKKVEEEMFYSINVVESNKSAPPQPIQTVQFVEVDDQELEIPKAIFD